MSDNGFQEMGKSNEWNIEVLRKSMEEILSLHLEKRKKTEK